MSEFKKGDKVRIRHTIYENSGAQIGCSGILLRANEKILHVLNPTIAQYHPDGLSFKLEWVIRDNEDLIKSWFGLEEK